MESTCRLRCAQVDSITAELPRPGRRSPPGAGHRTFLLDAIAVSRNHGTPALQTPASSEVNHRSRCHLFSCLQAPAFGHDIPCDLWVLVYAGARLRARRGQRYRTSVRFMIGSYVGMSASRSCAKPDDRTICQGHGNYHRAICQQFDLELCPPGISGSSGNPVFAP